MYTQNENHIFYRLIRSRLTALIILIVFSLATMCSLLLCNSRNIVIVDGAVSRAIRTSSDSTEEILMQAGITPLDERDTLNVNEMSSVTSSLVIKRIYDVSLNIHGSEVSFTSESCTVEQFFRTNGIPFSGEDTIRPSLNSVINSDCTVSIDRITYETRTVSEAIPHSTIYSETDSLAVGNSKIKTAGADGSALNEYSVQYVNGEETEIILVSQQIISEPTDEVVLVGTMVSDVASAVASYDNSVMQTVSALEPDREILLDKNGRPVNYTEVMTGTASAYTAAPGKHTSTGMIAQTGYVAVNPNIIPYGTRLYIRTGDDSYIYGYAIAADTGGFTRWGTRIVDLYFPTTEECSRFGLRNVEIYILD